MNMSKPNNYEMKYQPGLREGSIGQESKPSDFRMTENNSSNFPQRRNTLD